MNYKLPSEKIRRSIICKTHSKTPKSEVSDSALMVRRRPLPELLNYGIVNIDKPKGPTSFKVCEQVGKILHTAKTGHSGTLDPAVTGVLPVALGRATRIVQVILGAGKEYICRMNIHRKTESLKDSSRTKIEELFSQFTGVIEQLPPVKSAVKRVKRKREIYYLHIQKIEGKDVVFTVGCEKGTYIRKMVHDMGESLGCGAHMTELRRTKAGCFGEESLCSLGELQKAYGIWESSGEEDDLWRLIQPVENAVAHLGKVWVDNSVIPAICDGWDLAMPGVLKFTSGIKKGDLTAVLTENNELIALGEAKLTSGKMKENQKGIAVKVNKVFMKQGEEKLE